MQQRGEALEGTVERERGLHRRELRRRAKELADMQEELVQVSAKPVFQVYVAHLMLHSQLTT